MTDKIWKKFERWVGKEIFDGAPRNMGSGRVNRKDTGEQRTGDIIHHLYEIECKLRTSISIFRWWEKLKEDAAKSGKIPIMVMREKGNAKDVLVTMHYKDFIAMRRAYERSEYKGDSVEGKSES